MTHIARTWMVRENHKMASMRSFFLSLLIPTAMAKSAHGGETPCENPIPGLDLQSRGVDVTQLNLIPVAADNGYNGAVLSFICTQGKKITLGGVTYDQPDQVLAVRESPAPHDVVADTHIFKQPLEARAFLARSAGVDEKSARYAFSSSSTYIQMERVLYGEKRKVELVTAGVAERFVDLRPPENLRLSDLAQEAMNHLPEHYLETPKPYEEFIDRFGTHYFPQATFGGLLVVYAETDISYYETHSDAHVAVQAEAAFYEGLAPTATFHRPAFIIDEDFSANSTLRIGIFGGDPNIAIEHGLLEWMPTISAKPWLFSSRLAPISQLFTDASKRQQMDMAISDHVLLTYLAEELRGILKLLPNELEEGEAVKKLMKQIEDMMKVRPLVEKDVKRLGEKVEKAYVAMFVNFYADKDNMTKANEYNQQADFMCPEAKAITRIESHYSSIRQDREWLFGCSYLPGLGLLRNCSWTEEYVNRPEARIDFTCPRGALKGWHSVYDNMTEDRIHKFLCCQIEGAELQECSFTDFVNDLDAPLHFRLANVTQQVLSGVCSEYDHLKGDRRWKFEVCEQVHFVGKAGEEGEKKPPVASPEIEPPSEYFFPPVQ